MAYMFERKGVIIVEKTDEISEDALMEVALEAGMEDMLSYDDSFEIRTSPDVFNAVTTALKAAGYELAEEDVEYVPSMENAPTSPEDVKNLTKMIEALEDNDDVQKVYTNCSVDLA